MGPLVLGLESRFKAAVLLVGGLWSGKQLPAADPFNFAPHVELPVLMLNGDEDTIYGAGGEPGATIRGPRVSSSGMVLTVPSTYSLRAPAPSSEAGVLAQAATAP